MRNIISARDVTFAYPEYEEVPTPSKASALDGVSLNVERGQFVAILGPNGSGKSTFAQNLNALLVPDTGSLKVAGFEVGNDETLWDVRDLVGMVFQNPADAIVGITVEEDIAFGMENRNMPVSIMKQRITEALAQVGLSGFEQRICSELSGGEQQKVSVASAIACNPEILVLDESTALLDGESRADVLSAVHNLNISQGMTVILVTHHVEEVLGADRVFAFCNGKVIASGSPRDILGNPQIVKSCNLELPVGARLAQALRDNGVEVPADIITEDELMEVLEKGALLKTQTTLVSEAPAAANVTPQNRDNVVLSVDDLTYTYKGSSTPALKNITLKVHAGEFLGLVGRTGSGKSTLVRQLKAPGVKVGLVFQNPEKQLFANTVLEDVMFGPLNYGATPAQAKEIALHALEILEVNTSLYGRSPLELSGGEMRLVAIAGIIALRPQVLVADEPAAGLDPATKENLFRVLHKLQRETGCSVVLVSHSMDDVYTHCERVAVLNQGRLVATDTPEVVFGNPAVVAARIRPPRVLEMSNRIHSLTGVRLEVR